MFILTRIKNWEKSVWNTKGRRKVYLNNFITSPPNYLNNLSLPPILQRGGKVKVGVGGGGKTKNTVKKLFSVPAPWETGHFDCGTKTLR